MQRAHCELVKEVEREFGTVAVIQERHREEAHFV
jgi:hypothetical protein